MARATFYTAFSIYVAIALGRLLKRHVFEGLTASPHVKVLETGPVILAAILIWSVAHALRAWQDWRSSLDSD
jgi:hypothetical protein